MDKKKNSKEKETISISENVIPIINFFGIAMAAVMTFLEFLTQKLNLNKHLIYNDSIIHIDANKIIFNIGISFLLSTAFYSIAFLFKEVLKALKKKGRNIKQAIFKIILIVFLILSNYFLLSFCINVKHSILIFIYLILLIVNVMVLHTDEEEVKLNKEQIISKVTVYISLIIIFFSFSIVIDNAFNSTKSTVDLNKTDIYLAKKKKELNFNTDKSVLCSYEVNRKMNQIETDCSEYETVNNDDLIFKLYK